MTFSRLSAPLAFLLACLLFPPMLSGQDSSADQLATLEIGSALPSFELTSFRGREWSSEEFADHKAVVVIFMGTECPLVRLYASRLNELHERFRDEGVRFVGINSNLQDSLEEIEAFARDTGVDFPLLKDPDNSVADAFGAARTPEAFVFNSEQKLIYHGRIDDQYTYGRPTC